MHFTLKEESYVIIDNGSWRIKAGIGVTDTNQFPSVLLQTEVGKLPEIEVEKQSSEISQVSENTKQTAPNSPEKSEKDAPIKTAKVPKYVCGMQLKELKEQHKGKFVTSFPIKRGNIENWDELEALWRHILLKEFNIKRSRNECPVIVTVPSTWNKVQYERIALIFFETFNSPGLYIANQALMSLYGCGSISGLVVDIGYGKTEITPILECSIQHHAIQIVPIGGQDFDEYFHSLLLLDTQFLEEYGETPDKDFARALKESICEVLLDTNNLEDKPVRMELEYHGKKFTVGPERFHVAEPIFDTLLINRQGVLSLTEAIYLAIYSCEPDKRNTLWENIVLTGGSSLMKGLKERIKNDLAPYFTFSDNTGEYQVKEAKFLKVPDYFTNLKDRQDLAGFLGASITAKLSFPDPKSFINKVDYNEHGPSVIHTKSY
ncbi:4957_t:CDS:2 [Funneliformis mosseae]|uniref:4957_t:CDS:1 n=1 Tax=Funneliformis mosseae TaxID=27381 RepID=A0A9N9FRR0_FUNMO|nr:4957_t:CDS:2 [Funneliformis mosseae]